METETINEGRPVKSTVSFRLTYFEKKMVNSLAKERQSTKSELLREIVREVLLKK